MSRSTLKQLKRILAEVLGYDNPDCIPDNADMNICAEWDSLAHVNLLLLVKKHFGIMPAPNEIYRTISLPLLVKLLETYGVADYISQSPPDDWTPFILSLLGEMSVPDDACLYVHSSIGPLLEAGFEDINRLVDVLRGGKAGQRTLVFPAFPFSSRTYSDYIVKRPCFKVADTTALTGLLPEILRSEHAVKRSAHPVFSEIAIGPKSDYIVAEAHLSPHPFHDKSTYRKLIDEDAWMVGLGLDINTNAFIHMVDDTLCDFYPFPIYGAEPLAFSIEFPNHIENREFIAYESGLSRKMRPRNLRQYFSGMPGILVERQYRGVSFFVLHLKPFLLQCEAIGRKSLQNGSLPPWFSVE